MAVVINEMEVVVEAPSAPPPAGQAKPQAAPQAQRLSPMDMEDISRRLMLYHARVAAH
jgi:hypothetical protein